MIIIEDFVNTYEGIINNYQSGDGFFGYIKNLDSLTFEFFEYLVKKNITDYDEYTIICKDNKIELELVQVLGGMSFKSTYEFDKSRYVQWKRKQKLQKIYK